MRRAQVRRLCSMFRGTVKAAVGPLHEFQRHFPRGNNTATPLSSCSPSPIRAYNVGRLSSGERSIFGDANAIPLIRRLVWKLLGDRISITAHCGGTAIQSRFTWDCPRSGGHRSRLMGTSFRSPMPANIQRSRAPPLRLWPARLSFPHSRCHGEQRHSYRGSLAAKLFAAGFGCGSTPGGLTLRAHRPVVAELRDATEPAFLPAAKQA